MLANERGSRQTGTVRAWLLAIPMSALAACGLSVDGTLEGAPDDAGLDGLDDAGLRAEPASTPDAPPGSDGALGGGADVAVGSDTGNPLPSCTGLPAGWRHVALTTAGGVCPGGDQATDVLEKPVAAAGTCTCSDCTVTTHQSCAGGSLATFYDVTSGTASCVSSGVPFGNSPAGACVSRSSFGLGQHFSATPPAPTGTAACTATATADGATVTGTPLGLCAVTGCDAGALTDCVATDGDQACPTGPFATKHVVGQRKDLKVACGTCACGVVTTCKGTVTMSSSSSCSGGVTVNVDNVCYPVPSGGSYSYTQYTGVIAAEKCNPGPNPAATAVGFTTSQTVCCR